jgi:hypothetical protein
MDVTALLSLKVTFDLTGNPKLQLQDTSSYPPGVAETLKGFFVIRQPDGISMAEGNINAPNITWDGVQLPVFEKSLRLASDGKHQRGRYVITYSVLSGADLSTIVHDFEFNYQEIVPQLTELFDTFTPKLQYRDDTNYAQGDYLIVSKTVGWGAVIGTFASANGSADLFDLVANGHYYDAAYTVSFSRNVTYQHFIYSWLYIKEHYAQTIHTTANTPPPKDSLTAYLTQIKARISGKCCEQKDAALQTYLVAAALLFHIFKRLCAGQTTGLNDYFKEFLTLYYQGGTGGYINTNTPMGTYDPGNCNGTGGGVISVTAQDIINWNIAYNAIPPKDLELIVGVDADAPASGQPLMTMAGFVGWNLRVHINRYYQNQRPDWNPPNELWFSKPYASDTLTLSTNWQNNDLIQIEFYRSKDDLVGNLVNWITEDGQVIIDEQGVNPLVDEQ